MNTTETTTDLRLPAEWAEHFGITGLVAEEWQHFEREYVDGKYVDADIPEWDRPQTEAEFRRTLHGAWAPPKTEGQRYASSRDRSKKMPKFTPTPEAVRDALGNYRGWIPTTEVTKTLAEPLGWHGYNLPPNTKVMKLLKALVADGTVIDQADATDAARIPTAVRGEGSSKEWMLSTTYDSLREDRRLDEAEHDRRRAKLAGFLAALEETLVAEVDYSHATRLAYVDGIFDRDADTGQIRMDWETMERIINLSPRRGPSDG
jgi:hypothetical protein